MSYLGWRKENEAKYREIADSGAIELMEAYQESSKNELSDSVIGTVVQSLLDDPQMSIFHFIPIFCQYLHEEYHVSPADIEVLTQYVLYKGLKMIEDSTTKAAQFTVQLMQREDEESDEEDPNPD